MKSRDIISALEPVIRAFEGLGIEYYISGSLASSAYGIARVTLDVDLVANLKLLNVDSLVKSLRAEYYINENMINNAIGNTSSFNLIHLETMIKIDIFILKDTPFNQSAFSRKRLDTIDEEGSNKFFLAAPEDIILIKLEWYRKGGAVSQQQWLDILGVLKVQKDSLDTNYLRYWASQMNVTDMLEHAFNDVGINPLD